MPASTTWCRPAGVDQSASLAKRICAGDPRHERSPPGMTAVSNTDRRYRPVVSPEWPCFAADHGRIWPWQDQLRRCISWTASLRMRSQRAGRERSSAGFRPGQAWRLAPVKGAGPGGRKLSSDDRESRFVVIYRGRWTKIDHQIRIVGHSGGHVLMLFHPSSNQE